MRPLWASTSDRDRGAASCSWRWRADPPGDELLPPSDRREFFLPVTGASSSSRRPAQARAGRRPRAARVDPPRRREGEKLRWLTVLFLLPGNFSFPVLFLLSHTLLLTSVLGAANGGAASDLAFERRGSASGMRPSSPFPAESPLSPPPLTLCCMNQFVDELICDVLNPSV